MLNIFEQKEKSNKIDWHINEEINPMAYSSVTDEGLAKTDNLENEEDRLEKNSSDEKQIFHPLDKIY